MRTPLARLALLAALAPATALAQESNEELARQAFQRGVGALQAGRYTTAIAELEFSYGLLPRCSTQYNLAVAFEQTQRWAEAATTFQRYQRDCADTMPAANVTYVADALRRLRAHVATLTVRVTPQGTNATVLVDRRPRSEGPGEYALDPGTHLIEVRGRDGQSVRREITLGEGAREAVDISLGTTLTPVDLASDPYGPSAATATATDPRPVTNGSTAARLRIEAPVAHASVRLDGHELGEVPVDARVSSGRHVLDVEADGYRAARIAFTAGETGVTRLTPRLERNRDGAESAPFYTRWWFWTLVGAAAVGSAIAITWEATRPSDSSLFTVQAVERP